VIPVVGLGLFQQGVIPAGLLRSCSQITFTAWLDLFADGCVARFLQPATRLLGAHALPSPKNYCTISCKLDL
jgi:hypothetical protein